ncbi:DUF4193 domain-containing protein [Brevibacterium jeotgali]|uniref:DUF4193 domain-containing protein n=1 Tax=Brevibacterium jeotgali TaxID=1262550 RepID=A0A2H1L819_9MICO|nr:DUF4193 domain-containing protein [Brevibacterium jeotgali]TWC03370.1 uncharacterized protein DUF4193 [Brevibacterium jeotgali]SMY13032.1 protein of unknown function (DUF4193) [Brevibacterium jeotgali]
MTTDYDAPRNQDQDKGAAPLEEFTQQGAQRQTNQIDEDETVVTEGLELPGADLSGEELTVRVLPQQNDEFTCMECFLVHHISQVATAEGEAKVCADCEA